jgi:hypothetical protein
LAELAERHLLKENMMARPFAVAESALTGITWWLYEDDESQIVIRAEAWQLAGLTGIELVYHSQDGDELPLPLPEGLETECGFDFAVLVAKGKVKPLRVEIAQGEVKPLRAEVIPASTESPPGVPLTEKALWAFNSTGLNGPALVQVTEWRLGDDSGVEIDFIYLHEDDAADDGWSLDLRMRLNDGATFAQLKACGALKRVGAFPELAPDTVTKNPQAPPPQRPRGGHGTRLGGR